MSGEVEMREGVLYRLCYAAAVTVPWLVAIYAGFDCYVCIAIPRGSLDRLGAGLMVMFVLVLAAPLGVALGYSPRIRKPMGICGIVAAVLLGCVAASLGQH